MKKTGLILTLLAATVAWAQQADPAAVAGATTPEASSSDSAPADSATPVETSKNYPQVQFATPTYADLYCAGFITKQLLPNANYVAGGLQTPNTTKYVSGDIVYLAGQGYQPGAEYTIVRELRDVNEFEAYPGQHRLVAATGQPYAELGRVKILDTRNKTAVAQVEYSCDAILPGDTAIPFAEKPAVTYRPPDKFDRFAPGSGRTSGRIVLAKDFDAFVGTGGKVYMNVKASKLATTTAPLVPILTTSTIRSIRSRSRPGWETTLKRSRPPGRSPSTSVPAITAARPSILPTCRTVRWVRSSSLA